MVDCNYRQQNMLLKILKGCFYNGGFAAWCHVETAIDVQKHNTKAKHEECEESECVKCPIDTK